MPLNHKHRIMKNIFTLTLLLGLLGCSSQKILEQENIPFTIGQANVQEWLGGRAESGTGVEIKFNLIELPQEVNFEKVYFRARALACQMVSENDKTLIMASYKTENSTNNKIDEEGISMQKAFKIGTNEAVLSYRDSKDKLKYVKVINIKNKAPDIYKGKPSN